MKKIVCLACVACGLYASDIFGMRNAVAPNVVVTPSIQRLSQPQVMQLRKAYAQSEDKPFPIDVLRKLIYGGATSEQVNAALEFLQNQGIEEIERGMERLAIYEHTREEKLRNVNAFLESLRANSGEMHTLLDFFSDVNPLKMPETEKDSFVKQLFHDIADKKVSDDRKLEIGDILNRCESGYQEFRAERLKVIDEAFGDSEYDNEYIQNGIENVSDNDKLVFLKQEEELHPAFIDYEDAEEQKEIIRSRIARVKLFSSGEPFSTVEADGSILHWPRLNLIFPEIDESSKSTEQQKPSVEKSQEGSGCIVM